MGKLCNTGDGRQMSDKWIANRLEAAAGDEFGAIKKAMTEGRVRKVYAETGPQGTKFYDIVNVGPGDVKVGSEWIP